MLCLRLLADAARVQGTRTYTRVAVVKLQPLKKLASGQWQLKEKKEEKDVPAGELHQAVPTQSRSSLQPAVPLEHLTLTERMQKISS
jgi:hypothetical protein